MKSTLLVSLFVSASALTSLPVKAVETTALSPQAIKPYALDHTEVVSLPAKRLQREYEIYVSLPDSYASSKQSYPVMFVTDAPYAFPITRTISRRIGDHGSALQEFILVGLSYAKTDTPIVSRNRDYTPTDIIKKKTAEKEQSGQYGQAEAYRSYLANEVFPYIAQHYRADMQRKIFSGHSYGSLLGLHILFTQADMFDAYILGSPSLWFDQGNMFAVERNYAAKNRDLKAKVFLYVGGYETVRKGDPAYNQTKDLVLDMENFAKQLKARRYPHLSVSSQVIAQEDHLSVAPSIISRGLKATLGRKH